MCTALLIHNTSISHVHADAQAAGRQAAEAQAEVSRLAGVVKERDATIEAQAATAERLRAATAEVEERERAARAEVAAQQSRLEQVCVDVRQVRAGLPAKAYADMHEGDPQACHSSTWQQGCQPGSCMPR
jgi:chromosome segregation ATPase